MRCEVPDFARFVVVRALLLRLLEVLRIGIVADIAVISSATKTAAVPNSADAGGEPNAGGGVDAVFALMLQQVTQTATAPAAAPANDDGIPNSANDNGGAAAQTQSKSPAIISQALNLLAMLMGTASPKLAPQQEAPKQQAPAQNAAIPSDATASDTTPTGNAAASQQQQPAEAAPQPTPRNADLVAKNSKPVQSDDAKTKGNAKPAVQTDASAVSPPPQIQAVAVTPAPETNDTAPKIGQQKPVAQSDASTVSLQQMQTAAITPPPATNDTVPATGNSGKRGTTAKSAISTPGASDRAGVTAADAAKALSDTKQMAAPSAPQTDSNASATADATASTPQNDAALSTPTSATAQMAGTIVPHNAVPVQAPTLAVNLQVTPGHQGDSAPSSLDSLGLTIAAKSQDGIKHFDISIRRPSSVAWKCACRWATTARHRLPLWSINRKPWLCCSRTRPIWAAR